VGDKRWDWFMKKKIGIVGCGTIGCFIAKFIDRELDLLAGISGLCDINADSAKKLSQVVSSHPPQVILDDLIQRSDIIVETASAKASFEIAKKSLTMGKDIFLLSVGGILSRAEELFDLARKSRARLIIPSGAISGLDGIKGAGMGNIKSVSLTTKKPPKGLKGAPYIEENNIDLEAITGEKTIFTGSAEEAVKAFPKNINVSALLSIIGIGAKRTRVTIITSPEYMVNRHEVEVEGDFGRLITITENVACADNPKTSFLACLSAASCLRQVLEYNIKIGT
jgi:aspartate dehydrogenase